MNAFRVTLACNRPRLLWHPSMQYRPCRPCPLDTTHNGAMSERDEFLRIILPPRGIEGMSFTVMGECLIDAVVLSAFRDAGLRGFGVKTVFASSTKPNLTDSRTPQCFALPDVWELVPTGFGGIASPDAGTALMRLCAGCGYSKYSAIANLDRVFDQTEWDGSDVFRIWPIPVVMFVSDRAAEILHRLRLPGISIRCIDACEELCGNTLTPGAPWPYWPYEIASRIHERMVASARE